MKLLIQTTLRDRYPEQYDKDLLKELGVGFSITPEGLEIPSQKVSLDEVAMNTLFSEYLFYLDGYSVEYAKLGGVGCEFCLRITKNLNIMRSR